MFSSKETIFSSGKHISPFSTEKIGATGLEPVSVNSQSQINKELKEKSKTGTAQKLPKSPDLQQIITAWPSLPEHIKTAIKALIQTHNKEAK